MSKYEVIIYWSKDDRVFIAEVPAKRIEHRMGFGETREFRGLRVES